jgi:enoyl-CoA hydratase
MSGPGSQMVPLLRVGFGDHAVILTLSRPEAANALSRALVAELERTFETLTREIAAGVDLRAIVITGAGDKAFCAGADLKERMTWTLDDTRQFLGEINRLMNTIAAFPRPVIAAVNGGAFGGGFELALACDIRIAADTAELGLTEVRLGIIPGAGGTQRLARVAGVAAAKELTLTGRRVSAFRALELGIVSEVVPAAALEETATRWAREIAGAAPLALGAAKQAIDRGVELPLAEGLALERASYEKVLVSDDRNEGLAAFAEKRPAVYKGK